jgi:uncharacterized protein YcbK (DUF882 family)
LKTIAVLLFCSVIFAPAIFGSSSRVADSSALQERHLRLYHTHTGEHIDIVYRRGDHYLPEAEAPGTDVVQNDSQKQNFWHQLKGSIDFGYNFTSGNNQSSLSTAVNAECVTEH